MPGLSATGPSVPEVAVLVNGLPGSGKTTLARGLGPLLAAWVLSKDDVKQALAPLAPGVASRPLGHVAMDALWSLAAAAAPGRAVLLESWWFRPRDLDHVRGGLQRLGDRPVIELWCDVPPELARQRYAERHREAWHDDATHLRDDYADWAARGEPLAVGPVLRVDTSRAVDPARVARRVRAAVCRTRLSDENRSPRTT